MKAKSVFGLLLGMMVLGMFTSCEGQGSITCTPSEKTIGLEGGQFSVEITSDAAWSATSNVAWVSMEPSSGQGDAYVTIYVLPGEEATASVLFSNANGSTKLTIVRAEPVVQDDGALPGAFSVSEGKQVHFSKGNLQYQASTGIWRFAENQYDIVGAGNANISPTYDGWIDMFGWGTGNNPTQTSENDLDYSTFTDWGVNKISNGGDQPNLWRSLTADEMLWLFHGRTNATKLFGYGTVEGVKGMILLPDNWTSLISVPFIPSVDKGVVWDENKYASNDEDIFSYNTYDAEKWGKMEENGAVFIPAGGFRNGKGFDGVGTNGYCWTSTSGTAAPGLDPNTRAYHLFFMFDRCAPGNNWWRHMGWAVRLVQDM